MGKDKKRHRDKIDEDPADRERRKAAKKAEKVAKMLGYSNETNPFGDSNLLQPFLWGKKIVKDKIEGRNTSDVDEETHRLKLIQDIEKVRKRREEREKELEEMERLRDEEQRLREVTFSYHSMHNFHAIHSYSTQRATYTRSKLLTASYHTTELWICFVVILGGTT